MAQISYIKYTDVLEARRYDAEYFKPVFLEIAQKLQKLGSITFDDLIGSKNVFSGPFGSTLKSESYQNYGIPFIRISNIQDIFIEKNNLVYISEEESKRLDSTTLNPDDIVLSKIGTIGRLSLITEELGKVNISENNVGLRLNKLDKRQKRFLLFFLLSRYGQYQIFRVGSGNVQLKFNVKDIDNLLIPNLSNFDLDYYESIYTKIITSQTQSKQLYREAEQLLLAELGLLGYEVKHSLWFTTTKNEVSEAHRYDSEYFQPKYAEIIKKIEEYESGYFKLSDKNYAKISRGSLIPDNFYNSEKGNPYIRGADFSSGILGSDKLVFIDDSFQKTRETMVRKNDIVFSLIGSVGATATVPEDFDNSFISNNTGKISIKNFDSTVLQIILQSIIGKLQFEKEKTQTAQPKISSDQVGNFKIPLIKPSIQKQIAEKIQESHRLRKESKELLEEAKRKVEDEIER